MRHAIGLLAICLPLVASADGKAPPAPPPKDTTALSEGAVLLAPIQVDSLTLTPIAATTTALAQAAKQPELNVLDSPLLAFAHLQRVLEGLPQFEPVQAGEIVTTGTLTAALPIEPGHTWSTELDGIGLDGLRIEFRA